MAVSMLDNFNIRKSAPNVERDMFQTVADMKDYNENYLPQVFIATCVEDGCIYIFNKGNLVDDITGKWRKFEGGSADLLNYYNKTEVNALLENKVDKETGKGLSTNDYDDAEKGQVQQNKEDIITLNGGITVEGSVNYKVAAGVNEAKTYTDEQLALLNVEEAIKCDAQPTYDSATNKITYVKDGTSYTIDADAIWFYYEDNDKLMQSILLDGTWTTIVSAGGVNFSDYVSKTTDVVSDYTGEEAVTNKIPDLAAMKDLQTIVETELAAKLDIAQGAVNADKAVITDAEGNITLTPLSTLGGDAENVSYTNTDFPTYTDVDKALDAIFTKLYYVDPAIVSFNAYLANRQAEDFTTWTHEVTADSRETYLINENKIIWEFDRQDMSKSNPWHAISFKKIDFTNINKIFFKIASGEEQNSYWTYEQSEKYLPFLCILDDIPSDFYILDEWAETPLGQISLITTANTERSGELDTSNITGEKYILYNSTCVDSELDYIILESNGAPITNFQYENGQTIEGGVSFTWSYNKDITTQSLTDCTLADETVRNATYANDISASKTFTLSCGDGEKTASKSLAFQFMNKIYWGVAADQDSYDDAFILDLSGKKLATNAKGSYNFTAGTGQYCYFALPTSWSISVKVNGFDTDLDTVVASRSFTNASGYTTTYKIVRLHQASLGTLTAVVS